MIWSVLDYSMKGVKWFFTLQEARTTAQTGVQKVNKACNSLSLIVQVAEVVYDKKLDLKYEFQKKTICALSGIVETATKASGKLVNHERNGTQWNSHDSVEILWTALYKAHEYRELKERVEFQRSIIKAFPSIIKLMKIDLEAAQKNFQVRQIQGRLLTYLPQVYRFANNFLGQQPAAPQLQQVLAHPQQLELQVQAPPAPPLLQPPQDEMNQQMNEFFEDMANVVDQILHYEERMNLISEQLYPQFRNFPVCAITGNPIRHIRVPAQGEGIFYERDALLNYLDRNAINPPPGWPQDLPFNRENVRENPHYQGLINATLERIRGVLQGAEEG